MRIVAMIISMTVAGVLAGGSGSADVVEGTTCVHLEEGSERTVETANDCRLYEVAVGRR